MPYFPFDIPRIFQAYTVGEFPTLNSRGEFFLYRPQSRAIFPNVLMHVSKTLAQTLRKNNFNVTFNRAFSDVMRACVRPEDNWITPEVIRTYSRIHDLGWAHSVECWQGEALVGGLYGMAIGGAFFIESMFSTVSDASKVATKYLLDELSRQGFRIVDAQLMSAHLSSLGATEISNDSFLLSLHDALVVTTEWGKNRFVIGNSLSPPHIETERLVLRGLEPGDAACLFDFQRDPEVSRYTLVRPPENPAEARAYITQHAYSRYREGTPDPLAIALLADPDRLIGTIGCYRSTPLQSCMEISYDLDRSYWGQGFAYEAAVALIDYVFAHFAVERLQARNVSENVAGDRLNRKLGMDYEGLLRSAMYHNGRFWDLRYYSLLRQDWARRRPNPP